MSLAVESPVHASGFVRTSPTKKRKFDGGCLKPTLQCINSSLNVNLSSSAICRLRSRNTERLLREKKLILVLDLDHTLLHTVDAASLSQEEKSMLESAETDPNRRLFQCGGLVTKLRPRVRSFLKEASKMYDLYIYTMGTRCYASLMAKILDPEGVYFQSRIISREDCTEPHKKGLDVVLGEERMVAILDDTERVWSGHLDNLIPIKSYRFFGLRHGDASSELRRESGIELDGSLECKLCLLQSVHRLFFNCRIPADCLERDVRQLLWGFRDCRVMWEY